MPHPAVALIPRNPPQISPDPREYFPMWFAAIPKLPELEALWIERFSALIKQLNRKLFAHLPGVWSACAGMHEVQHRENRPDLLELSMFADGAIRDRRNIRKPRNPAQLVRVLMQPLEQHVTRQSAVLHRTAEIGGELHEGTANADAVRQLFGMHEDVIVGVRVAFVHTKGGESAIARNSVRTGSLQV